MEEKDIDFENIELALRSCECYEEFIAKFSREVAEVLAKIEDTEPENLLYDDIKAYARELWDTYTFSTMPF